MTNMKKFIFILLFSLTTIFSFGHTITSKIDALCISIIYIVNDTQIMKASTDVATIFVYDPVTKILKISSVYTDDPATGKWYSDYKPSIIKNIKCDCTYKNGYYIYTFMCFNTPIYKIITTKKLANKTNVVESIYIYN